jgi:hypothetical protein
MAAAIPRARALDRARCRARAAERYSAERMARDYVAVYEAAVATRRPVASGDAIHEAVP